tara:strand:- start:1007 stop:1834 length:828 start_codon:yes stop_codon:yes gene_type:complete
VSQQIKNFAGYHKVELQNFITSNGYLLKLETAFKLFEAGIRFFHITVDGPSHHHDQLRVLAGGGPSYAEIMKNLRDLLTYIPQAHLTLRMNADEKNVDSLYEVMDDIPADFRQRIQVNIFPILYGGKIPAVRVYQKINRMIRYALRNGYQYYDIHIPVKRKTFCTADKYNNFQIGFDGTLYKCSPATDKVEVKVGQLNAEGLPELGEAYNVWHEVPVVQSYCQECSYLCFCPGGCRLDRLRGTNDLACRNKYSDIENLIINRYLAIINDAFEVRL